MSCAAASSEICAADPTPHSALRTPHWILSLLLLSPLTRAASFDVPAWAFDRGNVATFTEQYADNGPMVAFGSQSPVVVEYDIPVPATGRYALSLFYSAASPRPVEFLLNGQPLTRVCLNSTGSWNTSGAAWESSAALDLTAGTHTLRFQRNDDFPHLVTLRLSSAQLPDNFAPLRPIARKLPAPPSPPQSTPASLRLAIEDLAATFGPRYPHAASFLQRLRSLETDLQQPQPHPESLARLQSLAHQALLANPLLDADRLLVLKRSFPKPAAARGAMGHELGVGSLNAHTSDDTPRQGHWNDELAFLSQLREQPAFTTLHRPANQETVIDPALHFNATRLLFAQNGATEKNWRLWEINLNGQSLRQVTPDDGADVAHFDPCYLPDGRIVFASTAVYQGLPCEFGAQAMTCLYLLDPSTSNIRQLTFEQDSDWCPTPLPNGRVMYLRWEYTDQSHANSRILFHMNPDGTDQRELRGSGSWFPGSFFYARPIPGESHQIIGIATGHHGTPRSGRLLILDPSTGRRDAEGIVQEIPGRGKTVDPIVRDRLADGVWPQFLMPWPLSAKYHLVAAKPHPQALWGIYLTDVFDNLTLITEVEGAALLWPILVQPQPAPPSIPDRVNLASSESTVFLTDIYSGPGLQGVPRGTVKNLRIIEYHFSKRGFGGLYGTFGIDGPWDAKRILGTVPVEPDGSASFVIPANSPLSLQPLDDRGQALQLMRSWFVGMPGEVVSCGGCHEPQNEVSPNLPTIAATRSPSPITPWHGPARGFSFNREVQPVLDAFCAPCHNGSRPNQPDFRPGILLTNWSSQLAGRWDGGGRFTESYFQLQRYVRRPGIEGDRRMFTPLDYHFSTTELAQTLTRDHPNLSLPAEAWERLAAWADLNAPFHGAWAEIPQFNGNSPDAQRLARVNQRAAELRRKYVPMGPHPDYDAPPSFPPPTFATPTSIPLEGRAPASPTLTTTSTPLEGRAPASPTLTPTSIPLEGRAPASPTLTPTSAPMEGRAPASPTLTPTSAPMEGRAPASPTLAPTSAPMEGRAPASPTLAPTSAPMEGRAPASPTSPPTASLTRSLDLGHGVTLDLVRIPGGQFAPIAPDTTAPAAATVGPFWMARIEISNRQFRQFNPNHESRTEDRHGYQFGILAYDQDQPDQPAVRVSWDEANAFCQWLSDLTRLPIQLPTESQWEWACRAGTTTPFWFGNLDADFSPHANLADQRLQEFAADTSLDNYSAARPMPNPNRYDDWIPRDTRFNDGGFVTEPGGRYQPNPWGLHDMHGNAWEWTRSEHPSAPQPVARGGSWRDRPHLATASARLAYPPWQRVYNVGFRIICPDLPTPVQHTPLPSLSFPPQSPTTPPTPSPPHIASHATCVSTRLMR